MLLKYTIPLAAVTFLGVNAVESEEVTKETTTQPKKENSKSSLFNNKKTPYIFELYTQTIPPRYLRDKDPSMWEAARLLRVCRELDAHESDDYLCLRILKDLFIAWKCSGGDSWQKFMQKAIKDGRLQFSKEIIASFPRKILESAVVTSESTKAKENFKKLTAYTKKEIARIAGRIRNWTEVRVQRDIEDDAFQTWGFLRYYHDNNEEIEEEINPTGYEQRVKSHKAKVDKLLAKVCALIQEPLQSYEISELDVEASYTEEGCFKKKVNSNKTMAHVLANIINAPLSTDEAGDLKTLNTLLKHVKLLYTHYKYLLKICKAEKMASQIKPSLSAQQVGDLAKGLRDTLSKVESECAEASKEDMRLVKGKGFGWRSTLPFVRFLQVALSDNSITSYGNPKPSKNNNIFKLAKYLAQLPSIEESGLLSERKQLMLHIADGWGIPQALGLEDCAKTCQKKWKEYAKLTDEKLAAIALALDEINAAEETTANATATKATRKDGMNALTK